jgi:hypothetical protein
LYPEIVFGKRAKFGDRSGAAFSRVPGYLWLPNRSKIEKMEGKKGKERNLF